MATIKFDGSKHDFQTLESKYRNFFAPAFEVIIDGTNIVREQVGVTHISVSTNVQQKSNSFSFSVGNGYDPVKREFRWLNNYFVLGKYVEIKMGYVDKLETVFYGLITNVSLDYPSEGTPTIKVKGMDVSFHMMRSVRSNSWTDKKASEVAKEIGSRYVSSFTVDDTKVKVPKIEQNEESDYQFVKRLAKANNYDFFIVGKKMYFCSPVQSETPVVSLMYGKNLLSFNNELDISYQVSQIVVRAPNPKDPSNPIEAKSKSVEKLGDNSKTGLDIMKSLGDYAIEYMQTNVKSVEEAQKLADSTLNERAMKLMSGSGECIGIPELIAGRCIELQGLGKRFEQPLYLTSVTHTIDGSGYITSFDVGGNAI